MTTCAKSSCDVPAKEQVRCVLNGSVQLHRGFDFSEFTEIELGYGPIVDAEFIVSPEGVLTLGDPIIDATTNTVAVHITPPEAGQGYHLTKITCVAELAEGVKLALCGWLESRDC